MRFLTISATALTNYERCPKLAWFKHIKRVPEKDLNGRNFVVGSAMHNALDAWVKGRSTLSTVPTELREFNPFAPGWTSLVAPYYLDDAIASQKVFHFIHLKTSTMNEYGPATSDRGYLLNKLKFACSRAEDIAFTLGFDTHGIQTELKFDVWIPGRKNAKHFGFIDVYDPKLNIIFDWKASKDDKWTVRKQIVYYAYMYGIVTGTKVDYASWLLPLKTNGDSTKTVKITDEDIINISNEIDNYLAVFDTHLEALEKFPKNSDPNAYLADAYPAIPKQESECNMCPYKSICPRHSQALFNIESWL